MSLRVLLVEDDRRQRETLVEALQLEGHTVHAADDGAVALEWLLQGPPAPPHVILLDMVMPQAKIDGFAFINRLSGCAPEIRDVPVILLSGLGEPLVEAVDASSAATLNIVGVLSTPVDLSELLGVTRAVGQRRLAQA